MNFILVDPYTRIISREEVGKPSLQVIYSLIGGDCDCISGYSLLTFDGHHFYCDDIGRLKEPPLAQFWLKGYPDPICGRILIFRATKDGREVSPTLTVDQVADLISFP